MNESFDPSLIIFGALAVFVLWKLRSVLGVRVDRDVPAYRAPTQGRLRTFPGPAPTSAPPAVDPAQRWKGVAEPGGSVWSGLDAIAATDASFSGEAFLEGARKAYDMIVVAFAKSDRATLQNLLSSQVFEQFAGEISAREGRGETMETAVVSIDGVKIESARVDGGRSEIALRYDAKLMTVRRNKDGEEIDGGLGRTTEVHELWTFARDPKSSNPNWRLVATQAL
jgi:predicted lipid-binding transport protein (Tim44 family)